MQLNGITLSDKIVRSNPEHGIVIFFTFYFALDLPYIPCSVRVFNRFLMGRWAFLQCLDQILTLLFSFNRRKRIIPVAC